MGTGTGTGKRKGLLKSADTNNPSYACLAMTEFVAIYRQSLQYAFARMPTASSTHFFHVVMSSLRCMFSSAFFAGADSPAVHAFDLECSSVGIITFPVQQLTERLCRIKNSIFR